MIKYVVICAQTALLTDPYFCRPELQMTINYYKTCEDTSVNGTVLTNSQLAQTMVSYKTV